MHKSEKPCSRNTTVQALLQFLVLCNVSADPISPGSILYASNSTQEWSSPNNTFSLHFLPSQPSTSSPSFMVVIAYHRGEPIIWSAGGGAIVDSAGSFQFLSTGNLVLVNGSGATIWESRTYRHGVSSAYLDDNGDFILYNGSTVVWSVFDNPTDTLVQSQNFNVGNLLQSGLYSLSLLRSGNLTLMWNNSIEYWNYGPNSRSNSSRLVLQPNGALSVSDLMINSSAIVAYSSDYGENSNVMRILKLENDGNLRIYSYSKHKTNATETWAAVSDQCQVFAYCGNMGLCSYNNSRTACTCPSQNFEMIHPNNSRRGCRRKVEIEDCPPNNLIMLQLNHVIFLTYPPETKGDIYSGSTLASNVNCLKGPCTAATSLSDGTGLFYMKMEDFISGYHSPALASTSFIKVCGPAMLTPSSSLDAVVTGNDHGVYAIVVVGTLLSLVAVQCGLWWLCCLNKSSKFGRSSTDCPLQYASGAPIQFSYTELKRLTNNFEDKIGFPGGIGSVYKGILDNGTIVAVKQLEGTELGEKQLRKTVGLISSTHHVNLVRLIGFCTKGRHRILVSECIGNESLESFLFRTENVSSENFLTSWECRYKIALGTARAIAYLHEECRDSIVHCNIKPSNILLDDNYHAKVSDFGLENVAHTRGLISNRGYIAPEWLENCAITSKSDVYSYGVVLLEIVSGRRNFEVSEETDNKSFHIWAYQEFEKDNIEAIIDKRLLSKQRVDTGQVKQAVGVSFWCIQDQPSDRPAMSKVVQMLERMIEN